MASRYCKEKIDVDKLAGAERVKEWLVTAYQLQCKLAALNFLLETSSNKNFTRYLDGRNLNFWC